MVLQILISSILHKGKVLTIMQCNDCNGGYFVTTKDGDVVCTSCGLVKYGCDMCEEPEWRSFSEDDDREEKIRTEILIEQCEVSQKPSFIFKEHLHMFDQHMIDNVDNMFLRFHDDINISTKDKNNKCSILEFGIYMYMTSKILHQSDTPDCIFQKLHVPFDSQKFWMVYNVILKQIHTKDICLYEKLTQITCTEVKANVHRLSLHHDWIEENKRIIIKKSSESYYTIMQSGRMSGYKKSVIAVSVLYYSISTHTISKSACVEIRRLIVSLFGISEGTLRKHEKIIRQIIET